MAKKKKEKKKKTVFRTVKEFEEMFFPKQTRKQEIEKAMPWLRARVDEIAREEEKQRRFAERAIEELQRREIGNA